MQNIWKTISEVLSKTKKKKLCYFFLMVINGLNITNNLEIDNKCNNVFVNVGKKNLQIN